LDGRAGLHVYFLLTALQMLEPGGRLAFIMPADVCEGVFAKRLWRWIAATYCLDGVVTFAPAASPFPRVDTNPLILLIRHAPPRDEFHWARCEQAETPALLEWTCSAGEATSNGEMMTCVRSVEEALLTGLSRPPREDGGTGPILADFARVVRGIATGANDFFHVFPSWARDFGIPEEFLVPAVGRTRDVEGEEITAADLLRLDAAGRPTTLLCLDGRPQHQFPEPVQQYLAFGEHRGLDQRPLIRTRRPWYKMEQRKPPPFLFAYLGRRSARFVRNLAGVVPLSGFLCVFPHLSDPDYVARLWQVLRDPRTVANLALVGKSYGGGAIKVEPRALESLPIPTEVLAEAHLDPPGRAGQRSLFGGA
jgi:adenine-specific DNA-methyltransferase